LPEVGQTVEAKRRMGKTKKTDKLDATGLAILLRNGTLPEVWIPPSELRDQRELLRPRICAKPYSSGRSGVIGAELCSLPRRPFSSNQRSSSSRTTCSWPVACRASSRRRFTICKCWWC